MRLSDILSRNPSKEYLKIEGFLNQNVRYGKQRKIDVGIIALPFYCKNCEDTITFISPTGNLTCIGIDNTHISIDTVLKCPRCNSVVPVWFLVECDDNTIALPYPQVRILNRSYKLFDNVAIASDKYGKYSELLEKANIAYNNQLGSGAIIYLRKIYEQIVSETAQVYGINLSTPKGHRRKFGELLEEVDSEASIVPEEYKENRYTLFNNLSNVIHGEYDETVALKQYPAFYRLVVGILDKINDNKELLNAIAELEWNTNGGDNE